MKSSARWACVSFVDGRSSTGTPRMMPDQPTWNLTTWFPPETGTQTSPNADAAGYGVGPTLYVATTLFVPGSIRLTVPSAVFGTNTLPSPAIAALFGPRPTLTRARTFNERGSSLTARLSALDVTQIARSLTAIESGEKSPTGTAFALFVAGSTRKMLVPAWLPTQIAPSPYRTWRGARPTLMVATIALVSGSMRASVPLNCWSPRPSLRRTRRPRDWADGDAGDHLHALRIDALDVVRPVAIHPQRIGADRDPHGAPRP